MIILDLKRHNLLLSHDQHSINLTQETENKVIMHKVISVKKHYGVLLSAALEADSKGNHSNLRLSL